MLNPEFDARFANLAMNDATVYEQSRLMAVFARAHPTARVVMIGLDVRLLRAPATAYRSSPAAVS